MRASKAELVIDRLNPRLATVGDMLWQHTALPSSGLCRSPPTGDRPMSSRITSAGSFDVGRPARLVRRSKSPAVRAA
jgi:hypothetical protein